MYLVETEKTMWEKLSSPKRQKISDSEIETRYENGEKRIIIEMNREKLFSFVDTLKKPGYMNTRPFYQRRDRWDQKKQSHLIESFLINIPVPPIILYEISLNSYEVVDGQQRINTIQDFYNNDLTLKDLTIWHELNGRTYKQLPQKIKDGIDRRSISSITVAAESNASPEEALSLKMLAFERINTGGVALSRQEIRNCLYSGEFNNLLLELSRYPKFAKAWNIPIDDEQELKENNL